MKPHLPIKRSIIVNLSLLVALALLAAWSLGTSGSEPVLAQDDWPQITLAPVAGGLERPVYVTHAGDGSERLFALEQAGRIRVLQDGELLATPLLDISGRVRSPGSSGGNEEGLLGLAFPPDYANKRYFYVYYTNRDGNNQVSRFCLWPRRSDAADPTREKVILQLQHPRNSNHNGGQLAFGSDGYLYIGVGDGGGGGDPLVNAQNLGSPLGKILRIDVESAARPRPDRSPCSESPRSARTYLVPSDNPFVDTAGARPEVWAYGLRNPWRFSFDAVTSDLTIGDVGQNAIEEIDFQPAASQGGENYGWNVLEGTECYKPASGCVPPDNYVPPVAEYSHDEGCSVTGGVVYRGEAYPELQGIYFYGDFCSGRIWGLRHEGGWKSQELLASDRGISSFGVDEAGNVYLVDMFGGEVLRLESQ